MREKVSEKERQKVQCDYTIAKFHFLMQMIKIGQFSLKGKPLRMFIFRIKLSFFHSAVKESLPFWVGSGVVGLYFSKSSLESPFSLMSTSSSLALIDRLRNPQRHRYQ